MCQNFTIILIFILLELSPEAFTIICEFILFNWIVNFLCTGSNEVQIIKLDTNRTTKIPGLIIYCFFWSFFSILDFVTNSVVS